MPSCHARQVKSAVAAVLFEPVPAITYPPFFRATATVISITCRRSSSVIVALSPVVPQGTRIFTPPFICRSTRFLKQPSSIEPSFLKGVTRAVAHPRIQSIFIVISFFNHQQRHLALGTWHLALGTWQ